MTYIVKAYTNDIEEPIEIEADFVSLINSGTYGIPPVFKDQTDFSGTVAYIVTTSPHLVAFEVTKS